MGLPGRTKNAGQFRAGSQSRGFTVVELFYVVIIIAVIAAIVIAQFNATTNDAKAASLHSTLTIMRAAIGRFHLEHGFYPGRRTSASGNCAPVGTAGTGTANSVQAFIDQLSLYTKKNGESCSANVGGFRFGPYMQAAGVPANPISNSNALLVSTAGALDMTSSVTNGGWKYDVVTGQFIADHADYDDR